MSSSPVRRTLAPLCLLATLTGAAGCGNQAVTPTPVLSTETFTGTLPVLGADSKRFTVTYSLAATDASITVTSLTTVANGTSVSTTISVAFGSIAFDGSCTASPNYTAATAAINQELIATGVFSPGQYCVKIWDIGTLTEPTNYGLTVKHF